MTKEELDRIKRAEEIQRYTENRCEALEKENADLKAYNEKLLDSDIEKHNKIVELEKENAELKEKLNRYEHDCPSCSAFGKHCPHRVNGDPYFYDCYLTVTELEEENAELRKACDEIEELLDKQIEATYKVVEELNEAKDIISKFLNAKSIEETCVAESEAEKFLKEE